MEPMKSILLVENEKNVALTADEHRNATPSIALYPLRWQAEESLARTSMKLSSVEAEFIARGQQLGAQSQNERSIPPS
jgi:hypothetical protein